MSTFLNRKKSVRLLSKSAILFVHKSVFNGELYWEAADLAERVTSEKFEYDQYFPSEMFRRFDSPKLLLYVKNKKCRTNQYTISSGSIPFLCWTSCDLFHEFQSKDRTPLVEMYAHTFLSDEPLEFSLNLLVRFVGLIKS